MSTDTLKLLKAVRRVSLSNGGRPATLWDVLETARGDDLEQTTGQLRRLEAAGLIAWSKVGAVRGLSLTTDGHQALIGGRS